MLYRTVLWWQLFCIPLCQQRWPDDARELAAALFTVSGLTLPSRTLPVDDGNCDTMKGELCISGTHTHTYTH